MSSEDLIAALRKSSKGQLSYDRYWTNERCTPNDAFCFALASVAKESEESKVSHIQNLSRRFHDMTKTKGLRQDSGDYGSNPIGEKTTKRQFDTNSNEEREESVHGDAKEKQENDEEYSALPIMHPLSPVDRALNSLEQQRREEVTREQMEFRTHVDRRRREIYLESRRKLKEALQIKLCEEVDEDFNQTPPHYPDNFQDAEKKFETASATNGTEQSDMADLRDKVVTARATLKQELSLCQLNSDIRNVFNVLLQHVDRVILLNNEQDLRATLKQLEDSSLWIKAEEAKLQREQEEHQRELQREQEERELKMEKQRQRELQLKQQREEQLEKERSRAMRLQKQKEEEEEKLRERNEQDRKFNCPPITFTSDAEEAFNTYNEYHRRLTASEKRIASVGNTIANNYRRAIQILVNCINSNSPELLKTKIADIRRLITGQPLEIEGQTAPVNSSTEPNGMEFCQYHVAKAFVKQSQLLIAQPTMAFPLAAAIVALWDASKDFGDFLMAHMARVCPYIIPFMPQRMEKETEDDFKTRLGFVVKSKGLLETNIEYENRMRGVFKLFAAISISRLPSDLVEHRPHPHGVGNIWRLIANVATRDPISGITTSLLNDVIEISGWKLQKTYGSQFLKLLRLLATDYFDLIQKTAEKGSGASIERLAQLFEKIRKEGTCKEPAGMLSSSFM